MPQQPGGSGAGAGTCTTDPTTGVQDCACVKLAVWGALGTYGAGAPGQDGQDAISAWLNENSTGTAEYFSTEPEISSELLSQFDAILLQDLTGWQFSGEELAAFEAWVRAGGGVMALQGYREQPVEVEATNTLLGFSGMQYAGVNGSGDISLTAENADGCAYCLGNSDRQGGFDPSHPISANVTTVGAFHGRSIDPGDAGQVVAVWDGLVAGATVQVDAGRVFLFHDEWVTYNSQWNGTTLNTDCRVDMNDSCYPVHPTTSFQIPQFWYNSLKWITGDAACFEIDDDTIVK